MEGTWKEAKLTPAWHTVLLPSNHLHGTFHCWHSPSPAHTHLVPYYGFWCLWAAVIWVQCKGIWLIISLSRKFSLCFWGFDLCPVLSYRLVEGSAGFSGPTHLVSDHPGRADPLLGWRLRVEPRHLCWLAWTVSQCYVTDCSWKGNYLSSAFPLMIWEALSQHTWSWNPAGTWPLMDMWTGSSGRAWDTSQRGGRQWGIGIPKPGVAGPEFPAGLLGSVEVISFLTGPWCRGHLGSLRWPFVRSFSEPMALGGGAGWQLSEFRQLMSVSRKEVDTRGLPRFPFYTICLFWRRSLIGMFHSSLSCLFSPKPWRWVKKGYSLRLCV